MSTCVCCKETNALMTGEVIIEGVQLDARVRFDLDCNDRNELDVELTTTDLSKGKDAPIHGEWTYSYCINHCMFCGNKLAVQEMKDTTPQDSRIIAIDDTIYLEDLNDTFNVQLIINIATKQLYLSVKNKDKEYIKLITKISHSPIDGKRL